MKTPVLIAARNEEQMIGACLDRLDASSCEPVVIANDCSDKTAEIARQYGADVIETETPGKLPAIQLALKELGSKSLGGVLILDADSRPLMPRRWAQQMRQKADYEAPTLVCGSLVWKPEIHNIFYSALVTASAFKNTKLSNRNLYEANLFLRPHDPETLDKLVGLDHVYPGEGRLLRKTVLDCGGSFTHCNSLGATVLTSDRFVPSLNERRTTVWQDRYRARAPEGSVLPGEHI